MNVHQSRSSRLVIWALSCGCQAPAPSPSELSLTDAPPFSSACLAETHPILAQVVNRPSSQLVAINVEGGDSIALGEGGFVYGPVWAPDGRSIALRRKRYAMEGEVVPAELVLLAADAGEHVVLAVDDIPTVDGLMTRYVDGPSWSPDGEEVAFASLLGSDRWRIWVISRTGGQRRLLFPELGVAHFYPSWSPRDAGQIAYVAEAENGALDLWVTALDAGEDARNLTGGRVGGIEAPRWSPDGTRIAISATERTPNDPAQGARDIYVIDVSTSELTHLTRDASVDVQPVWSPDGRSLLSSSTRPTADAGAPRVQNLWQLPLMEGEPKALTDTRSPTMSSDWYAFATCAAL